MSIPDDDPESRKKRCEFTSIIFWGGIQGTVQYTLERFTIEITSDFFSKMVGLSDGIPQT